MSRRARKQRRQTRQALRHGPSAKPRHVGRSGRTGGMHHKKTPSKKRDRYIGTPPRTISTAVTCMKCGARPGEPHQHSKGP